MRWEADISQISLGLDWHPIRCTHRLAAAHNTCEVVVALEDCTTRQRPVTVQGGRTGVSGGGAPGDGELVLSMDRLNRIDEFDRDSGIAVAGRHAPENSTFECLPLRVACGTIDACSLCGFLTIVRTF